MIGPCPASHGPSWGRQLAVCSPGTWRQRGKSRVIRTAAMRAGLPGVRQYSRSFQELVQVGSPGGRWPALVNVCSGRPTPPRRAPPRELELSPEEVSWRQVCALETLRPHPQQRLMLVQGSEGVLSRDRHTVHATTRWTAGAQQTAAAVEDSVKAEGYPQIHMPKSYLQCWGVVAFGDGTFVDVIKVK